MIMIQNPVTWSPVISTSSSYYPASSSSSSTPSTYYPSTSSTPPTYYPSTSSTPPTYYPSTSSTQPTYYSTPPSTQPTYYPTPPSTRPTSQPTTSRPVDYVPPPCTSLPLYCSFVEPFLPLPIDCIGKNRDGYRLKKREIYKRLRSFGEMKNGRLFLKNKSKK